MKSSGLFSLENILMLLICLIGIVLAIPFFQLSFYNVPGASDDFFHGFFMEDKNYLDGIWSWYMDGYNTRYSNAIFMQWPGRPFLTVTFGVVFPIVSFLTLSLSIFKFLQSLTPSLKRLEHIVFTVSIFMFLLSYSPNATQFYWFSGYTVYVMPAIFYFFLMSILLKKFNDKFTKIELTVASIFLFLIIGAHENWMVTGAFSIYFLALNVLLRKEKLTSQSIYLIAISTVFLAMVILGPGVTNRMEGESKSVQNGVFFDSFYYSFIHLSNFFYEWFIKSGFILIGFCLVLRSKPNKIKALKSSLTLPLTLLFFVFVLYTGFFVLIFSLGSTLSLRTRGIVPNFFVGTTAFLYVMYLIGSSRIVTYIRTKISNNGIYIILLCSVLFSISNSQNFQSVCEDLSSGKAEEQAENAKYIISIIENTKGSEVIIPQQDVVCDVLYALKFPEKNHGYDLWINRDYFKKSIVTDPNLNIATQKKTCRVVDGIIQTLIYKEFPFGKDYNLPSKKISNKTVFVKSDILNDTIPENAFFIIFQGEGLYKSINIKELVKNNKFEYKFDFPEMVGHDAKIYFTNTTTDTLVTQNFNCEILD